MEYLESLNAPQREAVTTTDGPMLVIAGAGSGKTRVLTMRIAYLLQQGVKPYNILALTFTNKAAREMQERIAAIVGPEVSRQLWMGTFHSVFNRILRIEAKALEMSSDFTIYDTQDSKSLIRSILKSMQLDEKDYKPSSVMGAISQAKNDLIGVQAYADDVNFTERDKAARRPRTAEIYRQYAQQCRKSNAMDFDDLLFYTHILFRDHPDILEKYQERFRYILVDEYQDTNRAQYIIVKKLAEKYSNLCVVGDDAQSIYSFRGARIENILGLERDYPSLKIVKLEQNYRSTQLIVNAANSLIEKNEGRLKKTVFSQNDEGSPVRICSASSEKDEAKLIVRDMALRMRNEGIRPSNIAILYRANAQSRSFEDELRSCRVPYRIYGGLSFYQRKEIKDILAYFRLSVNNDDSESLKRIINYPARAIGQTTQERIISLAIANGISMWQAMSPQLMAQAAISSATQNKVLKFASMIDMFHAQADNLNAYEFAAEVLSQSGIMKDLNDSKNDVEGKDRYDNVNELMNSLKTFVDEKSLLSADVSIRAYLEEVSLISDMDTDKGNLDQVSLMTIHSSKGLEFDHVYIVGVEDESFPGPQCAYDPKALEEERRLMYVAITRARFSVTMSYCMSRFLYGQRKDVHPSRFFADIDREFVERPDSLNVDRPRSSFHVDRPSSRPSFSGGYGQSRPSSFSGSASRPSPSSFRRPSDMPQRSSASSPSGTTFSVGQEVLHDTFGRGRVIAIEGDMPNTKLKIHFENFGVKQLLLKFARLKAL